MTPPAPDVTVLMTVFNGERYLREATDSILSQDLVDFELLVIDDGSTDRSSEILEAYARADDRIRLIRQENRGVPASLNRGLAEARGEYLARMDADDISLPHRLRMQRTVLERDPRAVLVAGGVEHIGGDSAHRGTHYTPLKDRDIRRALWVGNPLYHPSVMFRRERALEAGGYDDSALRAQDYDLYLRLAELGELVAVPAVVLRYRVNPTGVTASHETDQAERLRKLILGHRASTTPEVVGAGELRRWLADYARPEWSFGPPLAHDHAAYLAAYGAHVGRQVLRDNARLGFELVRGKERLAGVRQLLGVALTGRDGARTVWAGLKRAAGG